MAESNYQGESRYSQDEIDLVDLWLVFVRHKGLFAIVMAVCVALAGVYAWVKPVQYDYKATLEIGGYWSQNGEFASSFAGRFIPFEETETVVAKIKNGYGPAARVEVIKEFGAALVPDEIIAKSEKGQTVQLQVTLPADNAEVAFSLLNAVSNHVIQDHATLLQKRQQLLEKFFHERVATLNDQIEDLLQSRKAAMQESSSDTKALVMLMMDSRLQALESEKAAVQQELEVSLKADLKPTRLIFGPVQSPKPAGITPLLTILLGVIVGAILGIVAVMFRQLLIAARQRQAKLAAD